MCLWHIVCILRGPKLSEVVRSFYVAKCMLKHDVCGIVCDLMGYNVYHSMYCRTLPDNW